MLALPAVGVSLPNGVPNTVVPRLTLTMVAEPAEA